MLFRSYKVISIVAFACREQIDRSAVNDSEYILLISCGNVHLISKRIFSHLLNSAVNQLISTLHLCMQ